MATKRRLKVVRAIEANVGTRNLYAKKLSNLSRAFSLYVYQECVLHLMDTHALAMDASLSKPRSKRDKERLRKLQMRLSKLMKDHPEQVKNDLESFIQTHLAQWTGKLEEQTRKVCNWFVATTARDVTASMRRVLTSAGFPPDYMAERWTVPVVRGQYLSQQAAANIGKHVEWATNLVTKMHVRDVQRLQEVLLEGILKGQNLRQVKETLMQFKGFDDKRAARVALDQINKINGAIQRDNAKALGITQAIWVHVPGQYSSRETHVHMNGKLFDIDKGLYDEDVNKYVVPGELPFCRCTCRWSLPSVLPETK